MNGCRPYVRARNPAISYPARLAACTSGALTGRGFGAMLDGRSIQSRKEGQMESSQVRRVLIVANRTAATPTLLDHVAGSRVSERPPFRS